MGIFNYIKRINDLNQDQYQKFCIAISDGEKAYIKVNFCIFECTLYVIELTEFQVFVEIKSVKGRTLYSA